ncbi:hypothetical protein V9K67_25725 [Paraflavisolibacter sp. H34]|uniref:hypothetical protein n=1 Tax=Huijunlia imazamoxiresistens TaxID=3127457 RepID=UPI00301A847F
MDASTQFINNLHLPSDYKAVTFHEWQLQQAREKPYRLVQRLKQVKQRKTAGEKRS